MSTKTAQHQQIM